MFEKLEDGLKRAKDYCQQFVSAKYYDPNNLDRKLIPEIGGVYIWRVKQSQTVVYVGKGILFRRIIREHLSVSYETVLRKYIAEEFSLNDEQSAKYIKEQL